MRDVSCIITFRGISLSIIGEYDNGEPETLSEPAIDPYWGWIQVRIPGSEVDILPLLSEMTLAQIEEQAAKEIGWNEKRCCECLAPIGRQAKGDRCLICHTVGGARGVIIYALFVVVMILGLIWFGGGWR
jgi:hypothetical protein